MKKIILIVMAGVIVAGGIGGYFVFKKPESNVYQCPLYTPPAPSFYDNCEKKGGLVESGGKNDKGCQMPPQCVLSGTSSEKGEKTASKNSPFGFGDPFTLPKINPLKFNESLNAFNFSSEDQFHNYILDNLNFLLNVKFVRNDVFYNLDNKWIGGNMPTITKFKDNNWSILITLNTLPEGLPPDVKSFKQAARDFIRKYPWVKYWQIGNEMDLGEGWKKNYRQFPEYFLMAREAVKEVCGDCKIILGGISNQYNSSEKNYQIYEFIINELVKTSDKPFDIFDFHYYARGHQSIKKTIGEYRALLAKHNIKDAEMWVTEIGVYSGKVETGLPFQDEKHQASELIKDHILLLSSGVKKILWSALVESNFFSASLDQSGLIYNGLGNDDMGAGVKKLSYYAYKKMVEVLEGSDWNNIETIQEKDGIYVYKFVKGGKPIWVAWNDNAGEKQITISGVNSSLVKITEAVPNYSSGKDVINYNTAFKTETKQIINNKLIITLSETPVFVEEN